MAPVRITLHTLVRYWLIGPFTCLVLATLILAAFWYFQATLDAAERGAPWPVARTVAFFSGLVAVELAFQSSVAMFPYISFPMEVIQKLLLLVVAPPLLVCGAPVALALETSSPSTADRLFAITGSAPLRMLTHPVAIFFLYFLGLVAYYETSALTSSMRHVWLLNLTNLGFLAVALLFWWVTLGQEPTPRRRLSTRAVLSLVGAGAIVEVGLGIAIVTRTTPVASIYTLAGTHTGGAVLLVGMLFASVAAASRAVPEWYRGDQEAVGSEADDDRTRLGMSPPG
jgi:putative copper resistance protein D